MLPELHTQIPGPRSRELASRLRMCECGNITFLADNYPIFWERASGTNVWDVDGNRFLDLTSGFGVATAGWGEPWIADVFTDQSQRLYHGLGDVHPSEAKVLLCEALSQITFQRWGAGQGKVILGNSGFEAVEAALKTARLATGKPGVFAFEGGYHGLGYGAATACGMPFFRKPFEDQLASFAEFLPYPDANDAAASSRLENIERTIRRHPRLSSMGAILVEPMQGRGGERAPPAPFLPLLRRLANDLGFLLICDEIYTGFFRTGKWFACEHSGVVPDLICLGKAMSGGYPISACVGTSETMDAWPKSNGEALHTSTFLGNPVGCALAVRSIQEWRQPDWSERIVSLGQQWLGALRSMDTDQAGIREIRGQGLSIGVELSDSQDCGALTRVGRAVVESLKQGIILLGGGIEGDVITLSPNVKAGTVEIDWVTGRLEAILLAEQFRF